MSSRVWNLSASVFLICFASHFSPLISCLILMDSRQCIIWQHLTRVFYACWLCRNVLHLLRLSFDFVPPSIFTLHLVFFPRLDLLSVPG